MLVLSRKLGETIFIGDDIKITVVDIEHGKIRLGIEAPPAIRIDRQEVRDKIAATAATATTGTTGEPKPPLPPRPTVVVHPPGTKLPPPRKS